MCGPLSLPQPCAERARSRGWRQRAVGRFGETSLEKPAGQVLHGDGSAAARPAGDRGKQGPRRSLPAQVTTYGAS